MKAFSDKITSWYSQNKRDLPWRRTQDPYFIWLSEIILQQTRVDQGMAYYLSFAKEFPTVKHLAEAPSEKIMKMWQGLGYYSRARNLHFTAKTVAEKHKGVFPDSFDEVIQLKGVGEYTAAAIVSFAYNKPHAVVDGNVFRVLARVFGIKTPIDSTKGKKEFIQQANELLDKRSPGLYNQAIMEFGSQQCKPVNPDCFSCVLQSMCYAYEKKQVDKFPVKEKKTKVRNRYFNYLVLKNKDLLLLKKRTGKDIWTNLYDFPLIESDKPLAEESLLSSKEWKQLIGKTNYTLKHVSKEYKHILSHQKIYARFYEIGLSAFPKSLLSKEIKPVSKKEIKKYAVPRLVDKYLKESKLL